MSSPALELQGAIVAVLKTDGALQTIMGGNVRLYQDVKPGTDFPYATIGDAQQLPDKAECINGSEIFLDIHVWSRAKGDPEVRNIAASISDALDEIALTLPNHACRLIEREDIRFLRDPDGITRHAVLTFRALTEPLT